MDKTFILMELKKIKNITKNLEKDRIVLQEEYKQKSEDLEKIRISFEHLKIVGIDFTILNQINIYGNEISNKLKQIETKLNQIQKEKEYHDKYLAILNHAVKNITFTLV